MGQTTVKFDSDSEEFDILKQKHHDFAGGVNATCDQPFDLSSFNLGERIVTPGEGGRIPLLDPSEPCPLPEIVGVQL